MSAAVRTRQLRHHDSSLFSASASFLTNATFAAGCAHDRRRREGSDEFAGKWLCAHNASVRRIGGKRALFFTDVNPEPENNKRRKGYDEKRKKNEENMFTAMSSPSQSARLPRTEIGIRAE